MVLGARFQKLRGGGGAKFSRVGAHVFLETCYFFGSIVVNYSCHDVYINIFDIAEFLRQNNHGPI